MSKPETDPSRFGSTFAERKAAREGKKYDNPAVVPPGVSTFAERLAAKKTSAKKVDSTDTEDKAVKSSDAKKRTAKKS